MSAGPTASTIDVAYDSTASREQQQQLPDDDNNHIKSLCFQGIWAWLVLIFLVGCAISFIMFLIRKCIQGPFYRKRNRIDGKVVIITGCNTGIGKETALELARRGGKIYMACRDAARCEAARLEIIERTHNQQVYNRSLDLGSLSSVRAFAQRFKSEEQKLDILINNAGIMATPYKLTVDGFEQQFGVNHLGHFLLTNLLLDRLRNAAPSRIVVVSSAMYMFGTINKDDLMSEKKYSKFWGAYSQSKLANVLFTLQLSDMLKASGITVNCCHPGVVRTELNRYATWPDWMKSFMKVCSLYFFKSPEAGAQTTLRLALDPALEQTTGGYYADTMRFPLVTWAKDKQLADWLWQESERLVGLNAAQSVIQMEAQTSLPMPMPTPIAAVAPVHSSEMQTTPVYAAVTDGKTTATAAQQQHTRTNNSISNITNKTNNNDSVVVVNNT